MARTGKWPARISLALSAAMVVALATVITASGQGSPPAALPTIGIEVASATNTQATYSIVVRNQGTANSTGVRVRSTVPAQTTFESSTPPPSTTTSPGTGAASCNNGGIRETDTTTCEWELGTIPAGESRTIVAVYNLNQSNIDTYRVVHTANVTTNEQHNNSDTDDSLVRQRQAITDDTWVDDAELPNTNHGACNYLRVLQGNRVTSFLDADTTVAAPTSSGGHSTQTLESFYGAQLRAEVLDTTYTQGSPGVIGAHRITTQGDWTQGSGTCSGTVSTTTTDARTGAEPSSAVNPTGTATITGFPEIVSWDVTADLDTEGERSSFQGWELRDQAAGTDNSTRFHATESGPSSGEQPQDPRLFLVYTTTETPTCLDLDPDTGTRAPGGEHLMTVFVTDGAKTPAPSNSPGSGTGPGGDACNGGPVATTVQWEIEDDNPDAYFSSQEGQAIPKVIASGGNATPDNIETTADTAGLTSAGISLDEPPTGTNPANRVEARVPGSTDPDPKPSPIGPVTPPHPCDAPTPPSTQNCSGETQTIDDASVTWAAASGSSGSTTSTTSGSSGTTSGSSSTGSTASSSTSSGGSPSTTGSTASGSSPSRTTTGGTASGSSTTQTESPRTVSLFASQPEVVYPAEVTLSGQITSPDSDCDDLDEFVRIRRRVLGESEYEEFEAENTDAEGRFEVTFLADRSADYIAFAPRHDECADATSTARTVEVKVKVTARSGRRSVERGSSVGIVGRVQPDHDGTNVLLQRRKAGRFVTIDQARLNSRSRYRFVVTANWRGKRVFRVLWRAQDDEHATNNSANVVIRSRRP